MLIRKNILSGLSCLLFGAIWNITVVAASPPVQPELDANGHITWQSNVDREPMTLSSPDMKYDGYSFGDMLKIKVDDITKLDADLSGGVKGEVFDDDDRNYLRVEVFAVDNEHHRTSIYKAELGHGQRSLTEYSNLYGGSVYRQFKDGRSYELDSTDIKSLLQFATPYHLPHSERHRRWVFGEGIAWGAALGLVGGLGLVGLGIILAPFTGGAALLFLANAGALELGLLVAAGAGSGAAIGTVGGAIYDTAVWARLSGPQTHEYDHVDPSDYKMFPSAQPVVVEVTIWGGTFMGAKVPGIGEILPSDFFLDVEILVNDETRHVTSKHSLNALDGYVDTESINADLEGTLTMGDELTIRIRPPFFSTPYIRGVPDTWIARFAGDLMYYTTPSVVPGGHRPFLGYDTRVHNLMLRKYPVGFEPRYPQFEKKGNGVLEWSWTLPRRMDKTKSKYTRVHDWPKFQTLPENNKITLLDGTKSNQQRRNQKEGLNMQYLTYWPDWQTSDFQQYKGAKYMMGFDDDELAMLNTKYPLPQNDPSYTHPKHGHISVLKLERLPWKEMPEGSSYIYNETTGYPESGFVLNEMVTAYLRAKRSYLYPEMVKYNGYEIQDNGTNAQHPNGNGTGNNAAPGRINIQVLKKPINLSLNVKAPLMVDNGFYASIEGTKWPAYGEQNVPYTLTGLKGLKDDVLDGFSLEYQYEDKLGILQQQTHYLRNQSEELKKSVRTTGKWTTHFDIHLPAYASVTAYYQRTAQSPRVIIAGKELKAIFLLFTGVQTKKGDSSYLDLKEGRGIGSKIWLEDFRNNSYDEYTVPRKFGDSTRYTSKYSKEYVFHVGDKTDFVTFDGDPHTFASNDNEWYLGSRYMANRVTDAYLDGSYADEHENANTDHAYLKFYIKDLNIEDAPSTLQTAGRSGKEFTKTWSQAGLYEMKVSYRGSSNLYYKIKVVNYGTDSVTNAAVLGEIVLRRPKTWEAKLLASTPIPEIVDRFINETAIAEVVDIYSRYAYVDGPRATTPKENRWGAQRDFDSRFQWATVTDTADPTNTQVALAPMQVPEGSAIDRYDYKNWFWKDWAHHYSSNWLRPGINKGGTIVQGLPPGLRDADVTRIRNEKTELNPFNDYIRANLFASPPPAEWQYTIPLISVTKRQGMRMRTNPSCIYDLYKVFDPEHGAFSGHPNLPPSAESIQAPNPDDRDKDAQELFHKLASGQMLLLNYRIADGNRGRYWLGSDSGYNNLQVYNANDRTFVAGLNNLPPAPAH